MFHYSSYQEIVNIAYNPNKVHCKRSVNKLKEVIGYYKIFI